MKNGYMCVAAHTAADFADPKMAIGLVDRSGELLYDITWYDRSSKTLWFKHGPSQVADPSRQLYVTSTSSGQFSLVGSYIKLNGLKFKYLGYLHQQLVPRGCIISHCEIKHASGGICGGGIHNTYSSVFVDKIGDHLSWIGGHYDSFFLDHCFYFNGKSCLIQDCFFGRSCKGGAIQNYPDGVAGNVFDGNVLYNCYGGSIFMGTAKNSWVNNIHINKIGSIGPYIRRRASASTTTTSRRRILSF